MKKSLLFLTVFISTLLITFSISLSLVDFEYGDYEGEVLGAKSGIIDGELYSVGARFYNGNYYNKIAASSTLTASNIWYLPTSDGISGQVLNTNGEGSLSWTTIAGGGSVTYVGIAVPTGLSVTGTPITTTGTTTISLTEGYEIPLVASITNWETAYSWGDHAGLYDILGQATSTLALHTTEYDHSTFITLTSLSASSPISYNNETGVFSLSTVGVASGGTGATSLADHGVLVGSGTDAITTLTIGTNGQLLIGSTGADPVFATLNCDNALTCTTGAGTLEIDVDDNFLLNTGDTGTGAYDFGGADSFEIPNATSPTVDATGEIALDTTSNQIIAYGSAVRVIDEDGKRGFCFNIASSTNLISGRTQTVITFPYAVTFYEQAGIVDNGTSMIFNLTDGTNAMTSYTATTSIAVFTPSSNTTWNAYEPVKLVFGTNTGNVNMAMYCAYYRITAD